MVDFFNAQLVGDRIWVIQGVGHELMYLVEGSQKAMLVDTGMGFGNLHAFVRGLTSLPLIVINTHGHPDHAGGNPGFDEIWLHPADSAIKDKMCSDEYRLNDIGFLFGQDNPDYPLICDNMVPYHPTRLMPLTTGTVFDLGERRFTTLEVPGHTPGCIALHNREEKLLFIGDSIVATPVWLYLDHSLPLSIYLSAIKRLKKLEAEIELIFPGHKPTPLGCEMIDDLIALVEAALLNPQIGEPTKTFAGEGLMAVHGKATIIYNPANLGRQT